MMDVTKLVREHEARERRGAAIALIAAVLVLVSLAWIGAFDFERYAEAPRAIGTILGEMIPPDFSRWRAWAPAALETLAMSIAATAIAAILAFPLAALATPELAPSPLIVVIARGLLSTLRTIPEFALGIVLVAAVGFGALPGAIALALHSIGMLAKFYAEAFDHVDRRLVLMGRSVGADRISLLLHIFVSAAKPRLVDYVVYRWEHNIRASSVLGIVGAGGLGFELVAAIRLLNYSEAAAVLLIMAGLVLAVDFLGALLRRRFYTPEPRQA